MARLKLNKHELSRQRKQLALYGKILPSLDLKRRQLTVALAKAREELARARRNVERLEHAIGQQMPMLSNTEVDVHGLVRLELCDIGEENVVGVRLPVLRGVECRVAPYSFLAKPAWVDFLVDRLKQVAEERMRVLVATRRVSVLEVHERRTTQRVNLFERMLIPAAKKNIQRIRVFLGDQERAAVARSKLVKKKQEKLRAQLQRESP